MFDPNYYGHRCVGDANAEKREKEWREAGEEGRIHFEICKLKERLNNEKIDKEQRYFD